MGSVAALLRLRARRRAGVRPAGSLEHLEAPDHRVIGSSDQRMIGGEEFRDEPVTRSPDFPIVSVALPLPIRTEFSYRVPPGMEAPPAGCRVRVPFGERILT